MFFNDIRNKWSNVCHWQLPCQEIQQSYENSDNDEPYQTPVLRRKIKQMFINYAVDKRNNKQKKYEQ